METVWKKTGIWAKNVVAGLPGYGVEDHKYWSQRGWDEIEKQRATRIKHYTWAKIFKRGERDTDIFFSVGLGAYAMTFEITIDYQRSRDPKLNKYQQQVCEQFLKENILKGC